MPYSDRKEAPKYVIPNHGDSVSFTPEFDVAMMTYEKLHNASLVASNPQLSQLAKKLFRNVTGSYLNARSSQECFTLQNEIIFDWVTEVNEKSYEIPLRSIVMLSGKYKILKGRLTDFSSINLEFLNQMANSETIKEVFFYSNSNEYWFILYKKSAVLYHTLINKYLDFCDRRKIVNLECLFIDNAKLNRNSMPIPDVILQSISR